MTKLPELTKQEIKYIDATPDKNYPLRILQTYRDNCNCKWASNTDGSTDNPLYIAMNKMQDERAELLDRAIEKLQKP